MCGILGIVVSKNCNLNLTSTKKVVDTLFKLSETRGKESAGIAIKDSVNNRICLYKAPIPASSIIVQEEYNKLFNYLSTPPYAAIAHSRLVTNGSQFDNLNNQPVVKDGCVVVHNGIITNVDQLWEKYESTSSRKYEVDTEIIATVLRKKLKDGLSISKSIKDVFDEIEGSASVGILLDNYSKLVLATNTGSLYYLISNNCVVFASEHFILDSLVKKIRLFDNKEVMITKLISGKLLMVDIVTLEAIESFFSGPDVSSSINKSQLKDEMIDLSPVMESKEGSVVSIINRDADDRLLQFNFSEISILKRCKRCVLPETFPFIEFDSEGVCNYCKSYVKQKSENTRLDFEKVLSQHRKNNGESDCIVAFSGGRDSSYGLHLVKNVFYRKGRKGKNAKIAKKR